MMEEQIQKPKRSRKRKLTAIERADLDAAYMDAFLKLDKLWVEEWGLERRLGLETAPARRSAMKAECRPRKRPKPGILEVLERMTQESRMRVKLMQDEAFRRSAAMDELEKWRC